MAVAIPNELIGYVADGIASGRFRSEEEAVTEALLLLKERDRKLSALRADLQVGIDSLEAHGATELDVEEIMRRGRERLRAAGDT